MQTVAYLEISTTDWYNDMHDVCFTNITSISVHVIFTHFKFHVGCSFLAASLGWTKAVEETIFKLDRRSRNCKTIIKIPFFLDMTLHHVPGDRILSYTVAETSELITDIIHCTEQHTYRSYFGSVRNLNLAIPIAGSKSRYKKLLERSRSRGQHSGTEQDPSTGTYGSDKTRVI
jgi:hypothetical protein